MDTNANQNDKAKLNPKLLPNVWFHDRFPAVDAKYGKALELKNQTNGIFYVTAISEDFLAATIGNLGNQNAPTVYVSREDNFYSYDPDAGIYVSKSENRIISEYSELLLQCADECKQDGFCDTNSLRFIFSKAGQLAGVIKKAKGQLDVPEHYFSINLEDYIACSNGMLRLSDMELLPFKAEYRRRNKLSVPYVPSATCPIFLNTLMGQALNADDIAFLRKWFGLALLGKNMSQTILILSGTAQGGKSSFAKVVSGVIGKNNIATLRTEQLAQRFELASFLGKTLLHGADVQADFLNTKSASYLKSLTGGDSMNVELKNGRERPEILGEFNVLIVSNSRLVIHLEGDELAWKRRLAIIEYKKAPPKNPIPLLADMILKEEGSGVLNWALEGLRQLQADNWHFKLTTCQEKVVVQALFESDSPHQFAKECLEFETGALLTQEDCFLEYSTYSGEWYVLPSQSSFLRSCFQFQTCQFEG